MFATYTKQLVIRVPLVHFTMHFSIPAGDIEGTHTLSGSRRPP